MREKDFYWYWFANIPGVGIKSQKRLLDYFGYPGQIYHEKKESLSRFLTKKQTTSLLVSRNPDEIHRSMERLFQRGFQFMHRESPVYPERLLQLYEPPAVLYYKGKLPDYSRPILAMVGARRATIYGKNMAARFSAALAQAGVQIVSGLATGVDTASHEGALQVSGYTLGILGGGINTIYPRENERLYYQIYKEGCVMSEYNLDIPNQKGLFPVRNRIISGISDGVFVVEAGERSGSLITADQGLEQGKDIFALPGRITDRLSRGCNSLISQGAVLVRTPEDILEILTERNPCRLPNPPHSGKARSRSVCSVLTEHHKEEGNMQEKFDSSKETELPNEKENTVYALLDEITPVSFNTLLEQSDFSVAALQHILMKFELEGRVLQPEKDLYIRTVSSAAENR